MKNEGSVDNHYPIIAVVVLIVAAGAFVVSANWWTPSGDTAAIGANVDTSHWVKGVVLGEESDFLNVEHPDWKWFEETSHGFRIRIPDSHEVVMEHGAETEYGLTASETWQIAPKADAEGEYPICPSLVSIVVFPNSEKLSVSSWHQKEIAGWNAKTDQCQKNGNTSGCFSYSDFHSADQPTVFQEWYAIETIQNAFDVSQTCQIVDHGPEVVKLCMIGYVAADGTTAGRLAEEIGSTFEFTR